TDANDRRRGVAANPMSPCFSVSRCPFQANNRKLVAGSHRQTKEPAMRLAGSSITPLALVAVALMPTGGARSAARRRLVRADRRDVPTAAARVLRRRAGS